MIQLELFQDSPNNPVRYLTPEECVQRGYAMFPADALRSLMIPVDSNENVTTGIPETIKTSVQQQWNIVFK
jgi:hypothetical protein